MSEMLVYIERVDSDRLVNIDVAHVNHLRSEW